MENQNQSQENIKSDSEILSELRMLALQMSLVKKRMKKSKGENTEEPKEPKKRGRPRVEWRHGEDGKYNSQCIDPKYSRDYWRENLRKPHTCEVCGKVLKTCGVGVINSHQRSMHCQLAKLKKEQEETI